MEIYKVTIKSLTSKSNNCTFLTVVKKGAVVGVCSAGDVEFSPLERVNVAEKTMAQGVKNDGTIVYREKLEFKNINQALFNFMSDHFDGVYLIFVENGVKGKCELREVKLIHG